MTTELRIQRCTACATAWFPDRLLCPGCGGVRLTKEAAGEGVIEEETVLRREHGVRLGSVRLDAGPTVIARLNDHGSRVRLHTKPDGTIWAT